MWSDRAERGETVTASRCFAMASGFRAVVVGRTSNPTHFCTRASRALGELAPRRTHQRPKASQRAVVSFVVGKWRDFARFAACCRRADALVYELGSWEGTTLRLGRLPLPKPMASSVEISRVAACRRGRGVMWPAMGGRVCVRGGTAIGARCCPMVMYSGGSFGPICWALEYVASTRRSVVGR